MAELSKSLANFYATRAQREREARYYEELQKAQKIAAAEQAAAQAAAEEEKNKGGFFGGLGYTFEKIGLGFLSGLEGIWDYTAGGLAKLFGADDWAEQQFANDWVNYNHADEWFNPSEGWQVAGDVAGGIGTSLPAIAGVAAAGAIAYFSGGTLSGVSAGIISGVIAGLGAAGNATKEAYRETGELGGKEFGYGFLVGLTEGTIEGVSGAIGAGTGAVVKNMTKSFGKQVADTAVRQTLGKTIIKSFVGEAFEEGVAEFLDPYWKRITYDPDAKNASFQEIAYASLVGGLSGALMGGFDASVRNIHSTAKGKSIAESGRTEDVIATAENLSAYQTKNQTEYESVQLVNNVLTELKTSLESTNGEVKTWKQQMLLGALEKANTSAAFEDFATASAINIFNNAEAVAERLNAYGYTDANGNKITVTTEQLRAGIDTTNSKTMRKSMSKALKTNGALRSLAIIDATGRLTLNTAQFADATLRGQQLSSQADLNRFIETASESEMQAVAEKLGIEDWNTLTNEVFQERIAKFVADGGVENYRQEHALVQEAKIVDPATAKGTIPRMVNLRQDGSYRYTQGDIDIAIIKRGDSYRIFDYDNGRMSKSMTRTEINKALREIHTSTESYAEAQRQFTERENARKQQAIELDNFARTNIKGYENLSAANQSIIRSTIRQGRAAGLSDDFILTCARISTRSGLRIVFSKEMSFVAADGTYADGAIDLKHNRIIINPEAKNRTSEQILIHELTHAIYSDADGVITVAEGVGLMSSEEKNKIRRRYARVGRGGAVEVADEINAHFAEQTLSNKNILERLAAKKTTVKEKILSFFKKAKTDYQGDTKLAGAAARLFKQYQKLFDSFAQQNYQRNAAENLQGDAATSYALQTAMRMLGGYDETRKRHIESGENDTIAQGYADVVEFIKTAKKGNPVKRIHIGIINDATAALVKKKTGVDIKDYDFVLASNFIAHIFDSHGSVAKETPRGQTPVNYNNIENIIETVINPDDISVADDSNGKALRFEKQIEGRNIAITILSTKKSTLTLKSAWIINNNSGGRTPSASETTLAGTSETNGRNSTTDSISENGKKVNPKTKKNGKNVRYALNIDGETVNVEAETGKNLVALHNLSAEKLQKVIELGGFPMPSIAITTTELSHENYGDITVVFGRETIDPEQDSRNVVYDRDAWTPTTPRVDVKLDETKVDELIAELKRLAGGKYQNDIYRFFDGKYRNNSGEYVVADYDYSEKSFGEHAIRNSGIVAAYLGEKGIEIEPVYVERGFSMGWRSYTRQEATALFDYVGITKDITRDNATQAQRKQILDKYIEYEADRRSHFLKKKYPDITQAEIIEHFKNDYDDGHVSQLFFMAEEYFNEKRPKDIYDEYATLEKMKAKIGNEQQFYSWFWKKIESTFDKKGIDNDTDIFDSRGNRRSFEQRHYSYTVGNIVRAMLKGDQEGKATFGMSAGALAARLSRQFDSVDDIREAKHLLALVSEEDLEAFNSRTYELYDELVTTIAGKSSDFMSDSHRRDDVGDILSKCAAVKPLNIANIKRKFDSETRGYGLNYRFNDDIADMALSFFETLKHIPTTYFEAKPRRAVKLSEIKNVLIPTGKHEDLISALKKKKIPYTLYNEGAGENRSIIIKRMDGIRFALPDTDSDGRKLSDQQRKYFEHSKIVDKKGNLLVMYHGSRNEFTIFDKTKIGSATGTPVFGKGFYFAEAHRDAEGYADKGTIYKCYLNITNPYTFKVGEEYGLRTEELRKQGYDGVLISHINGYMAVAFDSNQIKLTTNANPTAKSDDIRYALDEDGNETRRGGLSRGQRAQFVANNTGMRVYSRTDAESVISDIIDHRLAFDEQGLYGKLRGKNKAEITEYLWRKLNTTKAGYRAGVALKIADYMIENSVFEDIYADTADIDGAMTTLTILRRFLHNVDLHGIASEVQYRYDKKNTIFARWGAPKGEGIAPDTLGQLLEEDGIYLDAINGADMFFQMLDIYENARATVNTKVEDKLLSEFGSQEEIETLRQTIAKDILAAYDQKGKKSKFANLVEKYTNEIQALKKRVRELTAENRLMNSIIDKAQKIKDMKLGTFLNATQYKSDVLKKSVETLSKIKFRGNFNIAGTRKIMGDLRTWYSKENPMLQYVDESNTGYYDAGIAEMLDTIAGNTKGYTKDELQMIDRVMSYFVNFIEHYNKVYRNGKWIDAIPEATRYIEIYENNEKLRKSGKIRGFLSNIGTAYMETFSDPMSVARRMDMYENGFYTEMLTELREAAIQADISEMQIKERYDEFMKKNKKYLAEITKKTVEYRGVQIPRAHIIGLYMTLKRSHSQAGFVYNGFSFVSTDGKTIDVAGSNPNAQSDADVVASVQAETAALEKLLTDTDREYIAILEQGYNQDAKQLKADRDMQRYGFTNATEGYYYPIRRAYTGKNNVDMDNQSELDRVSNSSFNKDTVHGAKQRLFIESADVLYNRHIHAVCQYAALAPAIENYNRLYNLDISGNANDPVNVRRATQNVWKKGNNYISKLISDIQGIPSVSGEGMKALGFIRGSYAKYQLGANPKVWLTQLSSLFASSSILDGDSIAKGVFVSAKGLDIYCPLAKLRNSDNSAAMAQGVIDKVGKVGNVLMKPIGLMDRFVVGRLFGACQVQVQKNGGAKVGTEANKVEAGKLLQRVILETQQNSLATERSAAMRSGNEIMRTLTMFTADGMKVVGRVIDSFGELSVLKAKYKAETDANIKSELKTKIKAAKRKVRKSVAALVMSALFMAGVAQLFKHIYNKDRDEDESVAEDFAIDFVGNLMGGLPLIKDVYARIFEGYDLDNYSYSAVNDLLNSAMSLFNDDSSATTAGKIKNLANSIGQLTGIPTRNIYNVFYGLTKRFSPPSAYKIDNTFYKKNYKNDLKKAMESGDSEMIDMLMGIVLNENIGSNMTESVRNKLSELYKKGYSVLPRTISNSITYNNETFTLNDAELSRFESIYVKANNYLDTMINSQSFKSLSEEQQTKAIKQLYDAYYYKALSDYVDVDEETAVGKLSDCISADKLSITYASLSGIESDKDKEGNTISGSRKKKVIASLLKQNLTDAERLLILCYSGYTIQNGEYKGYTARRAKLVLLKYILSLNLPKAKKIEIAEDCGFTVKNGAILRSDL